MFFKNWGATEVVTTTVSKILNQVDRILNQVVDRKNADTY
jgi:hypothetical protein